MSKLINQLKKYVQTDKGRALIEKARQEAAKPENRRRLQELKDKATRKR